MREEPLGVSVDGQVMPYLKVRNNFVLVGLNLSLETLVEFSWVEPEKEGRVAK